jgi:hypothetical protein
VCGERERGESKKARQGEKNSSEAIACVVESGKNEKVGVKVYQNSKRKGDRQGGTETGRQMHGETRRERETVRERERERERERADRGTARHGAARATGKPRQTDRDSTERQRADRSEEEKEWILVCYSHTSSTLERLTRISSGV